MQKEQIDRFVTLAGLEMPALISPGNFKERRFMRTVPC